MLFDSGYEDLKDHARRHGIQAHEELPNEDFTATWSVWDDYTVAEHLSSSEVDALSPRVSTALESLYTVAGEPDPGERLLDSIPMSGESDYKRNRRTLERRADEIRKLQQQFPDAGLKTMDEILTEAQEEARVVREKAMTSAARARGVGKLGVLAGTMTAIMRDPVILASLPFGSGTIRGGSIVANAWRAFKTEALIAGTAEALIQPKVYGWKQQIESPYSIKEAATNVMIAALGAGALRATGSSVLDIAQVRKVAKTKRAAADQGDKTAAAEADVLDQYLHLNERTAGRTVAEERAHTQAVEQAMEDLQAGQPTQATGEIPGQTLYQLDPLEIEVDAKTFQFKEGGDAEGVIDTLRGVDRWDPEMANTVMVWERTDGPRFIADGHQRLALAKRAIAGGQPPEEVRLHAILYRESDGYTPEFIRAKAAMRNIGMGVGTEIEAAKVLRELSEADLLKLPKLPPKGRIVASAKGLANLEDEAFQMVVNGMIDARFAAIIGEMIPDGLDQKGVIAYLSRHKPDNLDQARLMVTDIRAAGFERRETMDLFGSQEFSETLFKERAQVIDAAMKKLRSDKKIFKTLEEQAGTITEAGNILDRATNLERMTADERALALLTSLANRKGPVSDAVNAAARLVRDGEKPAKAIQEVLDEVAQEARGPAPAPKPEAVTPKRGEPVNLQELDEVTREITEVAFKSKQKGLSLEDYHKRARKAQGQMTRIGNELQKTLGDRVAFLNPGVKKIGDAAKKLSRKGYEVDELTDVCRCGFAVTDAGDVQKVINRISKTYEVLDEGMNVTPAGYFDQKLMVRFKDGTVGEVQIWEPHLLAAKEGAEFVDEIFPDHLKKVVADMDIPPKEKSGHALYDQQKDLEVDGKVLKESRQQHEALGREMQGIYSSAMRSANTSWKESLDSILPSSRISKTEAGSQLPGSDELRMKRPTQDSSESMKTTAGRLAQEKYSTTLSQSKSRITTTSTQSVSKDTKNIYQDTPGMEKIIQDEMAQVQRIIDEGADMDIPSTVRVDENGEIVVDTQSMRAAFDDLAEEERLIDDMFACHEGAA